MSSIQQQLQEAMRAGDRNRIRELMSMRRQDGADDGADDDPSDEPDDQWRSTCDSPRKDEIRSNRGCIGVVDPISLQSIQNDPVCLNNRCYDVRSITSNRGKDPLTQVMASDPENLVRNERSASADYGMYPTVSTLMDIAEQALPMSISMNEQYEGSLLERRNDMVVTYVSSFMEALGFEYDMTPMTQMYLSEDLQRELIDLAKPAIIDAIKLEIEYAKAGIAPELEPEHADLVERRRDFWERESGTLPPMTRFPQPVYGPEINGNFANIIGEFLVEHSDSNSALDTAMIVDDDAEDDAEDDELQSMDVMFDDSDFPDDMRRRRRVTRRLFSTPSSDAEDDYRHPLDFSSSDEENQEENDED